MKLPSRPLYHVIAYPEGSAMTVVETFADLTAAEKRAQEIANINGRSCILAEQKAVFSADTIT